MRRFCLLIGLAIWCLVSGYVNADTFKLANGETIVGELLLSSANDLGVQIKLGEGKYDKLSWASFSQDDLKKLSANAKLAQFVEPFIEISQDERIKKTEVKIEQPPRLDRPARGSVLGALAGSGPGLLILLLLYGANLFAAYEIAIFRARPLPIVGGVSAVLPIIGPILFLSLPTKLKPVEEEISAAPAGTPTAAAAPLAEQEQGTNPMMAEGAQHPAGLKLAHTEAAAQAALPPTVTYQRGQFTFNRRFFETKFPGFFGVVRRDSDKDMVLVIKASRGEFTGSRISRIAANDLHLQVPRGAASEEVMIPFVEIQEIRHKHKDA